jgi:hypothetical protein
MGLWLMRSLADELRVTNGPDGPAVDMAFYSRASSPRAN